MRMYDGSLSEVQEYIGNGVCFCWLGNFGWKLRVVNGNGKCLNGLQVHLIITILVFNNFNIVIQI